MKLYIVDITHTEYVMADSISEAERVAKDLVTRGCLIELNYVNAKEVKDIKEVPSYWRDCFPWNQDEDETIEEYFKKK
jgi:hypothetical protein